MSRRIAETKKNKYQKIPGGYFIVSNCRDLGKILSIPWNKIEDYLKYRIWDYYENSETKLFGHWSVIAEILGINPEELLSPTSDKKALLNYQELTAKKNQMEIEELYRNACLEYAKIKFKDEENELILGKAIGYGEILQIPETDTILYIDCFWDKLWEDEFSEMLDGDMPEEYTKYRKCRKYFILSNRLNNGYGSFKERGKV